MAPLTLCGFAAKDFLSRVLPHLASSNNEPASTTWFRTCALDRGLFHAMLFGQLTRNKSYNSICDSLDHAITLYCHNEAVRAVKKKISSPANACDDANIRAVLVLAFNGSVCANHAILALRQGPLTIMQGFNIYGGALEPVAVRMSGLQQILTVRGGIKGIQQPGLAQLLCY